MHLEIISDLKLPIVSKKKKMNETWSEQLLQGKLQKMQNYPYKNAQFWEWGKERNMQDEPGVSHCAKKEVLKEKCSDGGMSEEHRSQWLELSVAKMEQFEQDNSSTTGF